MGNNFTHLRPWVGISHRLFTLLSRGLFLKMLMAKSSRFYRLIKIFGTQANHYGLLRYNGSNCGAGNETRYGTNCESPDYCLSTILSSHIPAPMSMSAFGTLENTKTKRQVYLPSSTQTGSEDTSQ